jgi:hypothetical protein
MKVLTLLVALGAVGCSGTKSCRADAARRPALPIRPNRHRLLPKPLHDQTHLRHSLGWLQIDHGGAWGRFRDVHRLGECRAQPTVSGDEYGHPGVFRESPILATCASTFYGCGG